MQAELQVKESFGELLRDHFNIKRLCDGKISFPVDDLDKRIIDRHLVKNQVLAFPIYVNKLTKKGRNFLANPGIFISPYLYLLKEARFCPDDKTFSVRVNIVKSMTEEIDGVNLVRGDEREMSLEQIRNLVSDRVFKRVYRAIFSTSEAYTICSEAHTN